MGAIPETGDLKTIWLPTIAILGIFGFGRLVDRVSPITNPPVRQSGLDAHDGSASASLLGQFRTNASAWLWVRTDLYLHNGVHMRPITDGERKQGVQIQAAAKDGKEQLHAENLVTLVPPPDRDFRGMLGDVDRAVNAWKDMSNHVHNDPKQTLPLFRLMTWMDPQFIEAWTTGATVFARDMSPAGTARAEGFLREGLKNNPDSVEILTEIAYLEITRKRSLTTAIPLLEEARKDGIAQRATLTDSQKDGLEETFRWLAMCYRNSDQPGQAVAVARDGLSLFSDDYVLGEIVGNGGHRPAQKS